MFLLTHWLWERFESKCACQRCSNRATRPSVWKTTWARPAQMNYDWPCCFRLIIENSRIINHLGEFWSVSSAIRSIYIERGKQRENITILIIKYYPNYKQVFVEPLTGSMSNKMAIPTVGTLWPLIGPSTCRSTMSSGWVTCVSASPDKSRAKSSAKDLAKVPRPEVRTLGSEKHVGSQRFWVIGVFFMVFLSQFQLRRLSGSPGKLYKWSNINRKRIMRFNQPQIRRKHTTNGYGSASRATNSRQLDPIGKKADDADANKPNSSKFWGESLPVLVHPNPSMLVSSHHPLLPVVYPHEELFHEPFRATLPQIV